MKILIFSHEFPPQVGGAGIVAEQYASCLGLAGHAVTVLTHSFGQASSCGLYKVQRVKTLGKLRFLMYRKAVNFSEYDAVVLNDITAAYTAGLLFRRRLLKKSIMMLHGSEPENIFIHPTGIKKYTFFRRFYVRALKNVPLIVSVSKFMKKKFLGYSGLMSLSQKITVVPNFVDHTLFSSSHDPSFRASLGISNESFLLLTVSRVVFKKGFLEKLEIFHRLINEGKKDYYWVIVGDGADFSEIKSIVLKRGLSDRIFFLGSVNRHGLPRIYSSCDLFWLLSNFEESFGLVYLEAQACGCPVMGRNAAGVMEAIHHNESGYLVDNGEQAYQILVSGEFLKLKQAQVVGNARQFDSTVLMRILAHFPNQ